MVYCAAMQHVTARRIVCLASLASMLAVAMSVAIVSRIAG